MSTHMIAAACALAIALPSIAPRADVPIERTVLTLEEQWRIGGESEDPDELFGVLNRITVGDDGSVFLLDAQLAVVHVFDAEGTFVRRIGREGEGPGEFRRPADLLLFDDGTVGVVQRAPGKIVMMSPEGAPSGDIELAMGDSDTVVMLSSAHASANETIVATVGQRRFRSGQRSASTSLVRASRAGDILGTLLSVEETRNFTNPVIRERDGGMFGGFVWAAAADGRVFVSSTFDAYEIDVYGIDGAVIGTLSRPYTSRVRSADERDRMTKRFTRPPRGRGGRRRPAPTVEVSTTDRDVQRLHPREDGSLWVLSSHGALDAPEGAIATFDEFDPAGEFARQITLMGEGDFERDGFHVAGDRFFVVTGLWDAILADRGLSAADEDEDAGDHEDAAPVAVICYAMPSAS